MLTEHEEDYFVNLLAEEFLDYYKINNSSYAAETNAHPEFDTRLARRNEERLKKIRYFLNHKEDQLLFQAFHDRIPEYQRLTNIRAGLEASGSPLTITQEDQLVELMYHLREQTHQRTLSDTTGSLPPPSQLGNEVAQEKNRSYQQSQLEKAAADFLNDRQISIILEISENSSTHF